MNDTKDRPRLLGGPTPDRFDIKRLFDPGLMTEILYRAQNLDDDAYNELIDDIGSRAARLVLRAKACEGDVAALKLYLQLCKDDKKSRAEAKREPERSITPGEFGRRSTTTSSDELPNNSATRGK